MADGPARSPLSALLLPIAPRLIIQMDGKGLDGGVVDEQGGRQRFSEAGLEPVFQPYGHQGVDPHFGKSRLRIDLGRLHPEFPGHLMTDICAEKRRPLIFGKFSQSLRQTGFSDVSGYHFQLAV